MRKSLTKKKLYQNYELSKAGPKISKTLQGLKIKMSAKEWVMQLSIDIWRHWFISLPNVMFWHSNIVICSYRHMMIFRDFDQIRIWCLDEIFHYVKSFFYTAIWRFFFHFDRVTNVCPSGFLSIPASACPSRTLDWGRIRGETDGEMDGQTEG